MRTNLHTTCTHTHTGSLNHVRNIKHYVCVCLIVCSDLISLATCCVVRRPCDVVTDTHWGTSVSVCMCVCARVTSHLQCRTKNDSFLRSSSPCESGSIWHCYPAEGWRGNEGRREWRKEGGREGKIRGTAGIFQFLPLLLPLTSQFPNIKISIRHFVKNISPCPRSSSHPFFPSCSFPFISPLALNLNCFLPS